MLQLYLGMQPLHFKFLAATSLILLFSACATVRPGVGSPELVASESAPGLTEIVSELQLHLRDDTYRFDRAVGPEGRNIFSMALWRLERIEQHRGNLPATNISLVIEFARARALERSRRYSEAALVYGVVGNTGSVLAEAAAESRQVMLVFADHVGTEVVDQAGIDLEFIDRRIDAWLELAWTYRDSVYEPLAREESEVWEMLRVEHFARHAGAAGALESCHRLVQRHRHSKLYARHLIRLGDLYAQAAREEHLRGRTRVGTFNADQYEQWIDRAFASFELASEQRKPALRQEARIKIDALVAVHQGTLAHAH